MDHEMLVALAQPFPMSAHSFREGSRGEGFAYIGEEAIQNRFDELDPTWTFEIVSQWQRGHTTHCTGSLTLGGKTMMQTGSQGGIVLEGETGNEVSEPEKGAVTDCMRRCARYFGVGRYLLSAPRVRFQDRQVTPQSLREFSNWLAGLGHLQQEPRGELPPEAVLYRIERMDVDKRRRIAQLTASNGAVMEISTMTQFQEAGYNTAEIAQRGYHDFDPPISVFLMPANGGTSWSVLQIGT